MRLVAPVQKKKKNYQQISDFFLALAFKLEDMKPKIYITFVSQLKMCELNTDQPIFIKIPLSFLFFKFNLFCSYFMIFKILSEFYIIRLYQIKLILLRFLLSMTFQSTQNLIGFLAKKSLFKTDNKAKQINFSDVSSAHEALSRSITPKAKNQYRSQISQLNVFRDTSQKELHRKGISEIQKPSRALTNTAMKPTQQHRFEKIKPNDIYFSHVKQNTRQQNPQTSNFFKGANEKNKNLFTGFNPSSPQKVQAKRFDSLQLEAERCLQNISLRLNEQIHNLEETIEVFKAKMFKFLNTELELMKYKILSMIQQAFKQGQKQIKQCIKQQQKLLLKDVVEIKSQLQKQYTKINEMNIMIKTNEWRKTAAEMIGNDLENHVETLIDKAKLIQLKPPEIDNQEKVEKLNQLSKIIKEITQLKSFLK